MADETVTRLAATRSGARPSGLPSWRGARTILSRATDDSLNIETPSAGVSVQVTEPTGPWSIWSPSTTPSLVNANDPNALEVGVKFQASRNGYITAIDMKTLKLVPGFKTEVSVDPYGMGITH